MDNLFMPVIILVIDLSLNQPIIYQNCPKIFLSFIIIKCLPILLQLIQQLLPQLDIIFQLIKHLSIF